MDTHSEPFRLEFIHSYLDGGYGTIPVVDFVQDVRDWDDRIHTYAEIRENLDLELVFTCGEDSARCTMDGFDILHDDHMKREDGDPYMHPGTLVLFRHGDAKSYYPYIPGIYRIMVTVGSQRFYSFVKVQSNRLTEGQLDTMREEVESLLKGLALDLVRKNRIPQGIDMTFDASLFTQFKCLDESFHLISAVVADLSRRFRSSIKKEYILQPVEQPSYMDSVSIGYRLRHPESTNERMVRKNRIQYDLPENRQLKRIVEKWNVLLGEFILQVDRMLESFDSPAHYSSYTTGQRRHSLSREWNGYRKQAEKIRSTLTQLRLCPWYAEINHAAPASVPANMFMDERYHAIYRIDRRLSLDRTNVSLHPIWRFQWKRTDQLYEIWTFFKVLSILVDLEYAFTSVPEWMDEGDDEWGNKMIQAIPEGAGFDLGKGDLTLRLLYGRKIPGGQSETTPDRDPIYTNGRNDTPDIRVDVYQKGVFIGSIIMDAKYRKKRDLMDERYTTRYQLTSYADQIRSPYIYNKKRWHSTRPVHRVIVLYPDKWGSEETEYLTDENISFVPLTPGGGEASFGHLLRDLVEELEEEAAYFVGKE